MVSDGGKNSDCFKTIQTAENSEIESEEDHLTAIELSETVCFGDIVL